VNVGLLYFDYKVFILCSSTVVTFIHSATISYSNLFRLLLVLDGCSIFYCPWFTFEVTFQQRAK